MKSMKRMIMCNMVQKFRDSKTNIVLMSCHIPVIKTCSLLLKNVENNHDVYIELVFDHNDVLMRAGIFFIGDSPEIILFKKLKHRAVRSPIMKTAKIDYLLDFISSYLSNVEADKDFDCYDTRCVIQVNGDKKKGAIYVFGNIKEDYIVQIPDVKDVINSWSLSKELETNSAKLFAMLKNAKYSGVISWSYPYKR